MFSYDSGEIIYPFAEEEVRVGAITLFFSQFIILPLIGARVAVWRYDVYESKKTKSIEADKKAEEEFAQIVSLEIERLKPVEKKKPKRKIKLSNTKIKKENNTDKSTLV